MPLSITRVRQKKPGAELRVLVTTFPDVHATSKGEYVLAWEELQKDLFDVAEYAKKNDCPLIKLAEFGNRPNSKGCLRYDDNVLKIYGIEGDYDGGQMSMGEAAALAGRAGVKAMFYTSPSHAPKRPRWRVLAPTSTPLPPDQRNHLVARLNGVLQGVLAKESFTLSQSYFVGRVKGAVYHVQQSEGSHFVDQLTDLPEVYPFKAAMGETATKAEQAGDESLRQIIRCGTQGIHNALCSLASRFVGRGMSLPDVEATLSGLMDGADWEAVDHERWLERRSEIPNIVASAMKKYGHKFPAVKNRADDAHVALQFHGPSEAYLQFVDHTDSGNVAKLVQLTAGNLRYVVETGAWIAWRDGKWTTDQHGGHIRAATLLVAEDYRRLAAHYQSEVEETTGDKEREALQNAAKSIRGWEKECRNRRRIDAMCTLAAKDSRLQISIKELDRNPYLLGVENGVIDLRTGELRSAARDDFVTKFCAVAFEPAAKAPTWERFIKEITGTPIQPEYDTNGSPIAATVGRFIPRPDLAAYLQRALGYSLTGITSEHKMFICYGTRANGKNVLLDTVQRILGDYCVAIPPEALMAAKYGADVERPTSVAASLAGARLAVTSESKATQKLDVQVVKRHTGDGFMTARRLHQNVMTFPITHKLCLLTNHLPNMEHLDDAVRGRLHVIPFDRRWNRPGDVERDPAVPDGDGKLQDKLKAELAGVLAWLVRGAVMYCAAGLPPPPEVALTTSEYFQKQNPIPRFIKTLVRLASPGGGMLANELLRACRRWCEDNEENCDGVTQKALSAALEEEGIDGKRYDAGKRYAVRLSDEAELAR